MNNCLSDFFLKHIEKNPAKIYFYGNHAIYSYLEYYLIVTELSKNLLIACKEFNQTKVFANIANSEFLMTVIWACILSKIDLVLMPCIGDEMKAEEIMNGTTDPILISDIADLKNKTYKITIEEFLTKKKSSSVINNIKSSVFQTVKDDYSVFHFFSSGTTGDPKWISLSFSIYAKAIQCLIENRLITHAIDQKVLITQPLFHSYGMASLLEYTASGSSILLPKERSFIGPVKELLNEDVANIVTAIEGVPYFYQQFSLVTEKTKLSKLKHIGFGGGALANNTVDKIKIQYPNLSYSVRYGMTETPSVISIKKFEYPYSENWTSSGRVVPLYKLRIINEEGKELLFGEEGEIQIAGECIAGSFKNDEFFSTGDLGYIDEREELFITGRISTFIKNKGFRISPEYIEAVIFGFGNVKDCRVFTSNSKLVAEIVPLDKDFNGNDLLKYLKGKLSDYAVPNSVKFVESISRTKSGKIRRIDQTKKQ
jgi:acyl-CoA synthetase (AMP-forming)/AMP-acid ligase II